MLRQWLGTQLQWQGPANAQPRGVGALGEGPGTGQPQQCASRKCQSPERMQ
jgi:hypothetical protein